MHEFSAQSPALARILAAWLLGGAGCLGLGLLWQRGWGDPRQGADRFFMAFWSGLALAIGSLQLWHFARPVGPAAGALLLGAGLCGLVLERSALGAARPRTLRQGLGLAAAAAGALVLAHRCLRPLEHYDSGLYLLGAMTWFGESALVPGLANLHGRFGFNNSHLLLAALFDSGPWTDRAPNVLNGGLVAALLAHCLHAGLGIFGARSGRAGAAFAWLVIPPVLLLSARYLVSLSSDLPATLLALLLAWRTFRLLAGEVADAEARRAELRDATLLAAACICVKLSTLVFAAGVWLLAAAEHVRDARGRRAPLRRDVLASAAIAGALLLPWLARGAVLSGYPLYPSTALALPVDWRVPAAAAESEAAGVRAWARVPGVPRELVLHGWDWLESWARRHLLLRVGVGLPLPLLLGAGGVFLAGLGGSLGQRSRATRALWIFAPAAVALGFWFWMAPDPRFAVFSLWSIAAAGLGAAAGVWSGHPLGGRLAAGGIATLAVGLSLASLPRDAIRAGSEGGFHGLPAVRTERFVTVSGLAVNVPVGTDQCWRAARPCTPLRRAELRLRREGDPRRGFSLLSPPPPLVLLVVFDALRADHLSQYGYPLPTSPGLAALAARATLFREVYAPASYTTASTATLMTGQSPLRHGARRQGARLDDGLVTLAELLSRRGYRAHGVSFNPVVAHATGFTQGFHEFVEREPGSPFNLYPDMAEGLRVIRGWLAETRDPLFVYFQPMNTHGPYLVPPDARARLLGRLPSPAFRYYDELMGGILGGDVARRAEVTPDYVQSGVERYDTAIRYATDELGRLLDELDRAGRLDDALVVVTADHGEEFFEHGGFSHGYSLHEEVVRVPLVVKLPGQREAREVAARVSLADVLPTIAEAVGAEPEPVVEGRSLVALARGRGDPRPLDPVWLVAEFSPRLVARGVLAGAQKLVAIEERYDGTRDRLSLFDLASDPGEARDLAAAEPERARELAARLREAEPALARSTEVVEELDAERLRALGYAR